MATRQSTIEFLTDQLSSLRSVRTKKMFGEYALYYDEKVVALVCDDQLFVKITEQGKALVGKDYQEGFAYPGAKASMLVGADDIEDHERLCNLIRVTADALPPARPKKLKTRPGLDAAAKSADRKKTTATRSETLPSRKTPSRTVATLSTATKTGARTSARSAKGNRAKSKAR